MAEQNTPNVLKAFRDEVVKDDKRKEYASRIRPFVDEYMRKPHTTEEDNEFIAGLEDIINSMETNISVEKDIVSELKTALITVLKKHQDFDHDSILRDTPKRSKAKEGKDSGCYSATSVDMRLYTENDQLVTNPSNEDSKRNGCYIPTLEQP